MRCPCRRSRSGSRASSDSSSGSTSRWRPASRSWSIATSSAAVRSSSKRLISGAANGSLATSANGGPRQRLSASRAAPCASSRSNRAASTRSRPTRSSYPPPRVAIAALVGAAGHRLAQVGDVQLHKLRRRGRRVIAPQTVDQTLHRDGRAGLQREHGEQRALLRAAEGDRGLVRDHLDGSEQMHVHVHFPDFRLRSYVGRGLLIQCAHRVSARQPPPGTRPAGRWSRPRRRGRVRGSGA